MDSISQLIASIGQKAKKASNSLRVANTDAKNNALVNIANEIKKKQNALSNFHLLNYESYSFP